jgi:hypothetical protein
VDIRDGDGVDVGDDGDVSPYDKEKWWWLCFDFPATGGSRAAWYVPE